MAGNQRGGEEMTIQEFPKEIINAAQDIIKFCQKNDLSEFSGSFNMNSFNNDNVRHWGDIHFNWERGRHGDDSQKIHIRSEKSHYGEIKL
jgi:hypothetical protein